MDNSNFLEELSRIATDFMDDFLNLIPKIIVALIVLGIGYFIARIIKFLIIKLLGHLDRLVSQRFRNINIKQSANFIGTVFYWLILLSVFVLITDILGITVITNWVEGILRYSPNILAAILIIFAATVLGKIVSDIISTASTKIGFTYGNTLGKIAQSLVLITALIIAIDQIGIEITFLVNLIDIVLAALLFGAALAFGLGARTSVSNILASFYVRKMYKEGDYIKIGDIEGKITKIDVTVVVLDTETGRIIIPAKEFSENKSILISKK